MASTSSCCGRRSTPSRRTGRISDPDAIVAALEGAVDLSEARILHGAQGPFYGAPVDDDEGYSGRQRMVFPPGGLPHPESATDGPCGERPRPRCPNCGARPASSTRYGTSRSPTTGRTSGPATPRTWNSSRRHRRQPDAGGVHLRRGDGVLSPLSRRKRHRHDLRVRRAVRPGERTRRVPSGRAAAAVDDGAGTPRATGTPARLRCS
jgi:hypothetical protein